MIPPTQRSRDILVQAHETQARKAYMITPIFVSPMLKVKGGWAFLEGTIRDQRVGDRRSVT